MMPFKIVRILFLALLFGLGVFDYFLDLYWAWYFIVIVAFLIYVIVGSFVMKYNIFLSAYTSTGSNNNEIAITFDDGPAPITQKVLDVLKKYDAKATFFNIGEKIEQNPEVVKRAHAEGHLVGNHSYTHNYFFSFFRSERVIREIEKTNESIKNITGKENYYFRPPYGVTNPAIAKAMKSKQMKVIGWNLRSLDTVTNKTEKVINRVISRLKPGSIVLLHDNREETTEILEAILLYSKERDYKCITIEDIFKFSHNV